MQGTLVIHHTTEVIAEYAIQYIRAEAVQPLLTRYVTVLAFLVLYGELCRICAALGSDCRG